jgi:adenylate kinase
MKNQNNKYYIYFNILLLFIITLFFLYIYYLIYLENNKKYCIIFLGQSYSGKSFYSRFIEKILKLKMIDIGNILRKKIKNNDLDNKTKNKINSGKLVDSNIILNILLDEIQKTKYKNGFILDGCPRKLSDAKLLDKILKENNITIKKIFYLHKVDNIVIRDTLAKPRISNNIIRPDDTNISIIKYRLKEFHEKTKPVLDYYSNKNISIITINVNKKKNPYEILQYL